MRWVPCGHRDRGPRGALPWGADRRCARQGVGRPLQLEPSGKLDVRDPPVPWLARPAESPGLVLDLTTDVPLILILANVIPELRSRTRLQEESVADGKAPTGGGRQHQALVEAAAVESAMRPESLHGNDQPPPRTREPPEPGRCGWAGSLAPENERNPSAGKERDMLVAKAEMEADEVIRSPEPGGQRKMKPQAPGPPSPRLGPPTRWTASAKRQARRQSPKPAIRRPSQRNSNGAHARESLRETRFYAPQAIAGPS
jgi:hypothetical protein